MIVLQIKFLEDASIGYDSETPVRIPLSAAEYQFLLGSSESRYSPFKARLEGKYQVKVHTKRSCAIFVNCDIFLWMARYISRGLGGGAMAKKINRCPSFCGYLHPSWLPSMLRHCNGDEHL